MLSRENRSEDLNHMRALFSQVCPLLSTQGFLPRDLPSWPILLALLTSVQLPVTKHWTRLPEQLSGALASTARCGVPISKHTPRGCTSPGRGAEGRETDPLHVTIIYKFSKPLVVIREAVSHPTILISEWQPCPRPHQGTGSHQAEPVA